MSLGVAKLVLRDRYHALTRPLTGADCDVVGFYYKVFHRTEKTMLLLYDVFTGLPISREQITLSSLREDANVSQISMHQLTLFEERLREQISMLLIRNRFTQVGSREAPTHHSNSPNSLNSLNSKRYEDVRYREDVKRILTLKLLEIAGLGNLTSEGGYSLINSILLKVSGADGIGSTTNKHLINIPILRSSTSYKLEIDTSRTGTSMYDFSLELSLFADVVRDLLSENSGFCEVITGALRVFNTRGDGERDGMRVGECVVQDEDASQDLAMEPACRCSQIPEMKRQLSMIDALIHSLGEMNVEKIRRSVLSINGVRNNVDMMDVDVNTVIASIERLKSEVCKLGNIVDAVVDAVDSGSLPVIDLTELLSSVHALSEVLAIERGCKSVRKEASSYPSLIVTRPAKDRDDSVRVSLSSGDSIVLPSSNADISDLDTQTLMMILRYLSSVSSWERRFTVLRMNITREIALRLPHQPKH